MNTPAFQFYPGDWLKDPCLAQCSLATKGAWIELLAHMHESSTPGKLEGTYLNFARMCRCTEEEIKEAIAELQETKTATVLTAGNRITIVNRRMFKEFEERVKHAERQRRYEERKKDAKRQDLTLPDENLTEPDVDLTPPANGIVKPVSKKPDATLTSICIPSSSSSSSSKILDLTTVQDTHTVQEGGMGGESVCVSPPITFNDFKREYPRQENMKEAERVWKAKKLDRTPLLAKTIIEDVKLRKAEHGQWLDGVIPHASTYLRNERWRDAITPHTGGSNGQRHNGQHYSGREARRQSYRETVRNGIRAAKEGDTSLN